MFASSILPAKSNPAYFKNVVEKPRPTHINDVATIKSLTEIVNDPGAMKLRFGGVIESRIYLKGDSAALARLQPRLERKGIANLDFYPGIVD